MTRPIWKAELSILAMLVLAGAVSAGPGDPQTQPFPVDAIGRLIVDDSKVCTAFVIRSVERQGRGNLDHVKVVYENWIATAGHCAGQHTSFQLGSQRHEVRILGFSADGARGYDVLIGAFLLICRCRHLSLDSVSIRRSGTTSCSSGTAGTRS